MKIIKRKYGEFKLYHVSELSEEETSELKPFSAETEHDKYVLSEDGYRIPIRKVSRLNKWSYTINTPIGIFKWPNGYVHTVEPKDGFFKDGNSPLTEKQKRFAYVLALTNKRIEAVQMSYGIMDRDLATKKASALLKIEKVRKYVDKLTKEALADLGIDQHWVLTRIMQEADTPGEKNTMSALKELAEIVGMKNRTKRVVKTNLPLSPDIMKQITGRVQPEVVTEYEVTDVARIDSGTEDISPEEDA